MNSERLLNIAKALRETKTPEKFDMEHIVHECGTPGCAFGIYASRTDLQTTFSIGRGGSGIFSVRDGLGIPVWYDYNIVLDHFGITSDEAYELFSSTGCGNAKTPLEAAEYIERFVAEYE